MHVGRCRVGVDHEARHVLVASLGEVDHVAGPAGAALGPEAGVAVVGDSTRSPGPRPCTGRSRAPAPVPPSPFAASIRSKCLAQTRRSTAASGSSRTPRGHRPRPAHRAAQSRPCRPGWRRRRAWVQYREGAYPQPGGRSARTSPRVRRHAVNQALPQKGRSAPPAASRPPAPGGSDGAQRRAHECCPCADVHGP